MNTISFLNDLRENIVFIHFKIVNARSYCFDNGYFSINQRLFLFKEHEKICQLVFLNLPAANAGLDLSL